MRIRQAAACDVRSILDAAFAVRDTDPDFFAMWLRDALASSEEHVTPPADDWVHYASAISGCLRRSVFERDPAVVPEELRVESRSTFIIGDLYHALLQMGLSVHPDYVLLAHEVGGRIQYQGMTTRLSARCDAVFEFEGHVALIEIKTESPFAPKMRRADATAEGRDHTARPEHVDQLTATAWVLSFTHPHLTIESGWVVYVNKADGDIDQQQVPIDDVHRIAALVNGRDRAWEDFTFEGDGGLPERLKSYPGGLCAPRSTTDPRGKWCQYRTHCSEVIDRA